MAHGSQGNALAVAVVLAVVSAIAVALRFHVRRERHNGYGVDDWLCLPALVLVVICCSLIAAGSAHGSRVEHALDVPGSQTDPDIIGLQRLSYVFIVLQPLALGFIKASLVFFYRRVFCGRAFNLASWSLLSVIGLWSFVLFLASTLQCSANTSDFWTRTTSTARCHALPISGAFITTDVILDLAVMLLPIPMIVNLQMPQKKKALVIVVFLVGEIAIAAGFARLAFFAKVSQETPELLSQTWGVIMIDADGLNSIALFCPTIELGVALIAACLPSLQMTLVRSGNDKQTSPDAAWRDLVRQHATGDSLAALTPVRAPRPPAATFVDTVGQGRNDSGDLSWKEML